MVSSSSGKLLESGDGDIGFIIMPGGLGLRPSRQALSPGWMAQRGVQTDKWMVEWMENLPAPAPNNPSSAAMPLAEFCA